jgi:hypothetical protein
MDFKTTIDSTGALLEQSELGRIRSIIQAWNEVEWNQSELDLNQDATVNERNLSAINLFPALGRKDGKGQQAALIREFGNSLFRRYAAAPTRRRWSLKLTLPEAAQVEEVQAKLKDPAYATYRAIMQSFTRLTDRLVALNLTNALLVSGVKRQDSFNVDLRQWGNTLEYANVRKMHSLRPYVTAYGPRDVAESPGMGLAEKLVYKMGHISESSLADAYGRLIIEVFTRCQA